MKVIKEQNLKIFETAVNLQIKKLDYIRSKLEDFKKSKQNNTCLNWKLSDRFDKKFKSKNLIYIIKKECKNYKDIRKKFSDFKENKKGEYKVSSINDFGENYVYKGVLYIGTSTTSIVTRMNQHLGHTGKTLYSLQLNQWMEKKENDEVTIEIIEIEDKFSDIILNIENALWDYYQPLFGKKGPNVNSSSNL